MNFPVTKLFLTPNKWSRPQVRLKKIKGIVIHWVANPKSTAVANRNFFENRKFGKTNYGSAHFIVGLDGEIIQCLPITEMAYHVGSVSYTNRALSDLSNYPNNCTLGIECCHIDSNGVMTQQTWNMTVKLIAYLLDCCDLSTNHLWLHKEIVGWKNCHKWFVDNPSEWLLFKNEVSAYMNI